MSVERIKKELWDEVYRLWNELRSFDQGLRSYVEDRTDPEMADFLRHLVETQPHLKDQFIAFKTRKRMGVG